MLTQSSRGVSVIQSRMWSMAALAADAALDALAADSFEWAWLLGVWQTGEAGRQISLHQPEWQAEYRELLPDFTPGDVCGSPFAIREYVVNRQFGGPMALEAIRKRLADRNIKLMLDFVPNHTALDHPWVRDHPEFKVVARPGYFPR